MKKRTLLTVSLILTLLLNIVSCGKNFELRSNAFKNGGRIPDIYCNGYNEERQNISLPFKWVNPPKDTQSYALIIHDLDARNWLHWAVFNIPANCDEIAENASRNYAGRKH